METLRSVGIKLAYMPERGWSATVEFSTLQHANADCIEGEIGTRYFVGGIREAISRAKAAADQLGVVFFGDPTPTLYVKDDGASADVPLPPGWRQLLHDECEALGWVSIYSLLDETRDDQAPVH